MKLAARIQVASSHSHTVSPSAAEDPNPKVEFHVKFRISPWGDTRLLDMARY